MEGKRNIFVLLGASCLASVTLSLAFNYFYKKFKPPSPKSAIPLIDLSSPPHIISKEIESACLEHGFFYVTNHGISQSLIDEVFSQTKQFFSLPIEEKMKLLVNEKYRGFEPMSKDKYKGKEEELLKLPPSKVFSKENFFIGREISKESPEFNDPFQGMNQWPPANLLPDFRDSTTRYFMNLWELGLRISRLIALSLGLNERYFEEIGAFYRPMLLLRLLHYAKVASDPSRDIYAAKPHTDYGMITILANDEVSGLQILKKKKILKRNSHNELEEIEEEIWEDVPPIKGAFIINLGDMLQKWTRGKYKSSRHRVLMDDKNDRYSIPFFFEPNVHCKVKSIFGEDEEPIISGEHLLKRHNEGKK